MNDEDYLKSYMRAKGHKVELSYIAIEYFENLCIRLLELGNVR